MWRLLSDRDKVAMYAHEVIYRMYRSHFKLKTSAEIRKLVARLFSDSEPLTSVREGLDPRAKECVAYVDGSARAKFYIAPSRDNSDVRKVRFNYLNSMDLFFPIDVEINIKEFSHMQEIKSGPLLGNSVDIHFDFESYEPQVAIYIPKDETQRPQHFVVTQCN